MYSLNFNDLHVREGLAAVKALRQTPPAASPDSIEE